ncbi:MAG TPA: hypothetical protein VIY50_06440 [Steroidobacteraceae bacterium]
MRSRAERTSPRARKISAAITRAYDRFLRIALAMPGAEAATSYGTPAIKVKGKLLSRWRTEAEGALAIRCDFLDRQILLLAQPDVFFLTDHYRDYPMILMRIDKASRAAMTDAVERAWRLVAPAKLLRLRTETLPPGAA